jgi:hypothetical protein
MAIVIQQLDHAGQVVRVERFSAPSLRIGRALDSDFILSDPYSDARHCRVYLDTTSGQLRAQDEGALNGLWWLDEKERKQPLIGERAIASGQTLLLGKTLLRIYRSDHPIPAAKRNRMDDMISGLFSHWVLIALALLTGVGVDVWQGYLDNPNSRSSFTLWREALYGVLALAVYSLLWALIGRALVQHARYRFHLGLNATLMVLLLLLYTLEPVLAFNLSLSPALLDALMSLVMATLVGGSLYLACWFATPLRSRMRLALAAALPLLSLTPSLAQWFEKPRFQAEPPYSRALVAPAAQWRAPAHWDSLERRAAEVYAPYVPLDDTAEPEPADAPTEAPAAAPEPSSPTNPQESP